MHRLFVAIRPPEPVREALTDIIDERFDFRWQSDEQLHLTLRFVGAVDRPLAEDVAAALGALRFPPFDLRLAGLGSFDRRRGGALWVGVEPRDQVARLAAKVERACQSAGLPPEQRAFLPHVTIARWSGRRGDEVRAYLAERSFAGAPFTVTGFSLFESHLSRHGAHYERVADFPLAG